MSPPNPFAFDWLADHASRTPDAPAIGTPDGWVTYRELADATVARAAELVAYGVKRRSFVFLSLSAGPGAVASALAIQALGACPVEVHRETDAASLAAMLEQTGARHVITMGRETVRWGELARTRGVHVFILHTAPPTPQLEEVLHGASWSWMDESARHVSNWASPAVREPDAPALLVYTSGSTGAPRAVVQTHANIASNTEAICRYLGLTASDRALSILPLSYCYGRSILQTHLYVGGSILFDPRFTFPRVVMEALAAERCTGFYGVPLTFELLRRQLDPREFDLAALRYVAQAGGAMRAETIDWVRSSFAPAPLFVRYGQTEATARLSFLPPERASDKAGSIGRGLENVALRVVDEQGIEVRDGEVGELVASGPSVCPGYFGAPDETAALFQGGWLKTGDLAWRDRDGFFFLVGLAMDLLKLAGLRVSSVEIERALLDHPYVDEAAVIGVDDGTGSEVAVAFVLMAEGRDADPAAVRRFCRQKLPAFKVPRYVARVSELPRTASGKVAKAELQEAWKRGEIFERRADAGLGEEGG